MATEAQLRANREYKKKVKKILLEFHPTEMEMWEHLQQQEKKQTYIKNLIRADMNKEEA
jgi:hypothetical protein